MSRIGISLSGMERSLLNRLAEANAAAAMATLRKATGHRINRPADDPSAFLTLSNLQTRLQDVRITMKNVSAAGSMISQTRDTLGQIETQLNTIRTELLKDEDGSLTPEERAESQAKIDAAIDAIGGLAAGTINGRRVLDGSAAFRTSGVDSSQVANLTVYRTSATSGATAAQTIFGRVLEAATKAELVYAGKEGSATIQADATFVLTGSLGSAEFSVSEDDPLTELRDEINRASHKTGLVATLSGDNLSISSVGYGAAATIAVEVSDGTFTTTGGHGDGTASGTDATVEINGQTYGPETRTGYTAGNTFTYNENGFHYSLELRAGYQGTLNTMTVGDGALRYAISPDVGRTSALSIPSLLPARLGGISGTLDQLRTGGSLGGLGDNTSQAIRALDEALGQLTLVRGSVDGFYNSQVASASALLADLETDLEDAIDEIDGVNVAEEDTLIAYYQDLAANAVSGMAILSQQRASIVQMLRHIAGLA